MITQKAIDLSEQVHQNDVDVHKISQEFWEEVFTNCDITMEEFDTYAGGMILSSGYLWRIIAHVIGKENVA